MLLRINTENPEGRKISQVVDTLKKGGVIIYPTDTVYGLGCDIFNQKAVERICRLRKLDPKKAHLSFICNHISQISKYTQQIGNETFRLMKRNLPGPFTFILKSNNTVPKLFKNNKRTVGVRVPDNLIVRSIIEEMGHPLLTTSLKSDDEILEYFTDPIDIYDDYKKLVDIVIDGGIGGNVPSTLIDCTDSDFEILREGAGELS
ncbi:MAG: L-threonylcarbamoyladenylate synthase [Saprospiraceae bacterium]|jgi:tRNA threonylcarbamoyl adenosine modification protein (Sua5/YciO/YrdC/YwlC family)|nr:L-threonylcarbamoyladenylate synthase [Saprospiraceae bacterium]